MLSCKLCLRFDDISRLDKSPDNAGETPSERTLPWHDLLRNDQL
ncbi:hypothetical protein F444_14767 [Phytophthora nicotianae P1976]|uniref:Uncharacterized protein n=1 Tax=Phytophthora nicotianae P1976 TaxID=1317066 RepID=A0A080ZP18_PHYNI|nr:hypothetical protein F444_14767 [Phytophthora nicotianae P1976]